jgi:hypothetical protein
MYATLMDTLTPSFNVPHGVATAYSVDLTLSVPRDKALTDVEASCARFGRIAQRLAGAGVSHVLSPHPLADPGLDPLAVLSPARLAPLSIHAYRLRDPLPLFAVAREVRAAASSTGAAPTALELDERRRGSVVVEGFAADVGGVEARVLGVRESPGAIDLDVEADRATAVVVRQSWAPGWTASVDGAPAPLLRADGRHLAAPAPAGRSRVALRYRPPRAAAGAWLTLASAVACCALALRRAAVERVERASVDLVGPGR